MKANRKIHNLVQGSPEWLAFRAQHYGASEAAAMLGISPKKTRDELLREKHTGLAKEFSQFVQEKVLNEGHRLEALARPNVEEFIGDELYPVTMSLGRMSASCDGLTMDDRIAMEHKAWNEPHAAHITATSTVPPEHMPQCQQVLHVTGAERLLFVMSDGTRDRFLPVWVLPEAAWVERLERGWAQFELDLANYVPAPAAAPAPVGKAPQTLPSITVELRGEVLASNLVEVKSQAVAVFEGINRDLQTDQDFADAVETMKWCSDIEARLKAAKEHALGQAKSIDEVFKAIDEIVASASRARLDLNKLVERRKEERKGEIVAEAIAELRAHVESLNKRLGQRLMPAIPADFAGVIKGKRSFESMQAAVNSELARAKIDASAVADRIQANVQSLEGEAHSWAFLFPDLIGVASKSAEDFANLLTARIAAHKAAEEARRVAEDAAKVIESAKTGQAIAAEQRQRDERIEPKKPTRVVAAPSQADMPSLKLGDIVKRLGFSITGVELERLGVHALQLPSSNAKLYREADFDAICDALIAHIERVKAECAATF